ncbi:response regulator [Mariniblastus sp.]|nr:response regulator [Mariniblastus sp.]
MNMSDLEAPVKPIDILLVDDDPGDVLLTQKALKNGKIYNSLSVAKDGVEALEYLRREGPFKDVTRPDLILLDLNMPRKNGKETLEEIKKDPDLKTIPVVVLTTSDADKDVLASYDLNAACYVTKPVDIQQFTKVVNSLKEFWLCVVKFPPR